MNTNLFTPLAIFVPAIIAIISWGYNAKKMRELEEFKMRFSERLKVRIEMLKSLITFKVTFDAKKFVWDTELTKLLSTAYLNFQLYGEKDEQKKMENFANFMMEKRDNSFTKEESDKGKELLLTLVNTSLKSLRTELNITE